MQDAAVDPGDLIVVQRAVRAAEIHGTVFKAPDAFAAAYRIVGNVMRLTLVRDVFVTTSQRRREDPRRGGLSPMGRPDRCLKNRARPSATGRHALYTTLLDQARLDLSPRRYTGRYTVGASRY